MGYFASYERYSDGGPSGSLAAWQAAPEARAPGRKGPRRSPCPRQPGSAWRCVVCGCRRAGTLEHTAELIGIDLKHLQKVEAGTQNITLATLERIGAGLGVDMGAVLEAAVSGRTPRMRQPLAVHEPPPAPLPARAARPNPIEATTDLLERVGGRLAELRLERRMTQRELAERAGVPLGFVQRVEGGRVRKVTVQRLGRLAAVLGVDAASLFEPPSQHYRRHGRPNRLE